MMPWQSPTALICKECGYEVEVVAIEKKEVTAPIDKTDMQADWGNREQIHLETLSEEVTCGCRVCPYTYDATTDKALRNEEVQAD